jgi:hypothetical protein
MTHKLINVIYNPKEPKKLRKWSGSCCCGKWNVMGPSEKALYKMFSSGHKNVVGIRL